MKARFVIACLALSMALNAGAAELTLFDNVLRTVARDQLRAAVERSGGKLISSVGDIDQFNVEKIGLNGAKALEVVFIDGQFVLAKYTFKIEYGKVEEFRAMLFAKYGPQAVQEKQRWEFDGGMQLVFYKPFLGDRCYLTYVHRGRLSVLEARSKAVDQTTAQRRAASNKSLF